MDFSSVLELFGTLASLAYLFLLMRQSIWCWLWGILSSLITVFLLLNTRLYSEALLNLYYVFIGAYGWWKWKRAVPGKQMPVTDKPLKYHLVALLAGSGLSLLTGALLKKYTDANNPYVDAGITVFSFFASFLEANKILSGWFYWMVINATSIWLMRIRGMEIYSGLMVIYTILSVWGYFRWRESWKNPV